MSNRCDNCRFWIRADEAGAAERGDYVSGICRRMPPAPLNTHQAAIRGNGRETVGMWPIVKSADWCGEFRLG